MNGSSPHEPYRTPRLRQAARTLVASGGQRNRKRQKVNTTIVLKEQNKENICLKSVAENPKIVSKT